MNARIGDIHRDFHARLAGTIVWYDVMIKRLGLRTIRQPSSGSWSYPDDAQELRLEVELEVNYLGTTYKGLLASDHLIVEALYPYSAGLIIGTKVGGWHGSDRRWIGESHSKQKAPSKITSSFSAIDLSSVTLEQREMAHRMVRVASVQNLSKLKNG
jgi:pyridoxine 4-dehydrogenase